jgi:universal stress protein A
MRTITKILVPTDLSDFSIAAVEYAASLADLFGARIYMLYVIEGEPNIPFPPVEWSSGADRGTADEQGRKDLHRFVYWKLKELGNVIEVVRSGRAHVEIPRFAVEAGIDLIVMATHGRTGLSHVLMGSVAEKVVRTSPVPVMTIKPKELQAALVTEKDIEEELHLNG